ncbi:MAG: insulinase family protein [Actinomycetota bacterium]|nr:insulinase family protein [Actinomycetota bacterium]
MTFFQRDRLANGVRVVAAPMPHAQSVACFLGFAAGSRYETRETRGTAHFVEHMLFTGTERRPTMTAISGEVDALGAQFNASTRKDSTTYWIRCTSEHLGSALDILVDMVRNSTFRPAEIEREKGVIAEEMNMIYQSPRDYVDELFEDLLYGDRPLGWPVIGARETVAGADRDELVSYVRRWYTASRLVVGIAGGVEGDDARPLEDLLADLPAGDGGFEPAALAAGGRVALEHKESDQAEIAVGAPSFPLAHRDRYVLELIRALLGGGMSSRLYRELVSGPGLAYTVQAIVQSYVDAGSIWAQAGVSAAKVDDAVSATAREFRRLADEPVPADELEKARNYAKGRFVFQVETPQGLMGFALRRELVEGKAPEPKELLAALDAVTAQDVQRVARELFGPGTLRLAVIGPFEDRARFERLLE